MSTPSPNKLCLLTDPYLSDYEVRSLENAVNKRGIEIPLVIVNASEEVDYDPDIKAKSVNEGLGFNTAKLFLQVLSKERAWSFVIAEKKLAEILGIGCNPSKKIHMDNLSIFSDSSIKWVSPNMDGSWYEFSEDIIRQVQETSDVVLRYGFGLIKGAILDATEYGVLSFHPANLRRYRGLGPPKAFLDGANVMGLTLQLLTEKVDGGEIVAYDEIDINDCYTLWEIYDKLHKVQENLLCKGIENLRKSSNDIISPDSLGPYYSTKLRRDPSFATRILIKNFHGRLVKLIKNK